jgi:glycosyltransferase involved in cell wall biosynthesis
LTSRRRVNILYVHPSDELYGADRILLQLVEQLDKQRFRPIVVLSNDVSYDGLLSNLLKERNINYFHLNLAVLRRRYFTPQGILFYIIRLFISTLTLAHIIWRNKIDIVHSNTLAVIPGALAAFLTRKNHIWHVHEIITKPRFLWRLTAWLSSHLSRNVVAVSKATCHHLCNGNINNKDITKVIHNGFDISRYEQANGSGKKVRKEWGISFNQPLVGMLGRFSNWKGQDYFLEVASSINQNYPNVRFALVGGTIPGQEEIINKLKSLANNLNLSSVVIFDEFRTDVPAVLDAFDIFVLPSILPEPFGLVVVEAMATGKPVVANSHGGCKEIIENGVTGFLVEPNKPEEMVLAIKYLIDNPKEGEEMGQRGRERLKDHFSLISFVDKWTNVYEQLSPR